jgi:translation initiation factor IF-1
MRPAAERDVLEFEGTVREIRGGFYSVDVEAGAFRRSILCKLSGKLFVNRIRVIVGDLVRIECSPYDFARGRIVHRTLAA